MAGEEPLPTKAGGAGWRTRANALSLLRLALAPAIATGIGLGCAELAAALLVIAIATDFADGAIARRYGETSALGGLIDHSVDATLCVLGLGALALVGSVPWPLPPLVGLSFLQYVLDSRGHRGRPLRGSWLGRWNGIAYYVLLATPVVRDALGLAFPASVWVRSAGWLLVLSTLVSMASRWSARRAGGPDS